MGKYSPAAVSVSSAPASAPSWGSRRRSSTRALDLASARSSAASLSSSRTSVVVGRWPSTSPPTRCESRCVAESTDALSYSFINEIMPNFLARGITGEFILKWIERIIFAFSTGVVTTAVSAHPPRRSGADERTDDPSAGPRERAHSGRDGIVCRQVGERRTSRVIVEVQ